MPVHVKKRCVGNGDEGPEMFSAISVFLSLLLPKLQAVML